MSDLICRHCLQPYPCGRHHEHPSEPVLPPVDAVQTKRDIAEETERKVIAHIDTHWFIQGGEAQFGKLNFDNRCPANADELVSTILRVVRGPSRPSLKPYRFLCPHTQVTGPPFPNCDPCTANALLHAMGEWVFAGPRMHRDELAFLVDALWARQSRPAVDWQARAERAEREALDLRRHIDMLTTAIWQAASALENTRR